MFFAKTRIFSFTIACLFNLATVPLIAQIKQTSRYEVENKGSDDLFTIVDLDNDGLALVRARNKYSGSKKMWEFIRLDTALQEKFVFEFYMEERHPLIGYEIGDKSLFFLFKTGETNKNNLRLVELSTTEGKELSRYDIKPELDINITHFSRAGQSIVFGGYVSNDPAIILFSLTDQSIKVVPGFFIKDSELIDIRVNQNQTFNIVLIDRSLRSERKFILKTFDEHGNLLLEDNVLLEEDLSLQHSITSSLQREDLVVLGTWGDRVSKQAHGFFALPIDPFQEQKIQYFHLGELTHFLDYLNPKRADRIKEKTKEDISEGKRPFFTASVIPHRLEETSEGYLLLADVYNPVNSQDPYSPGPYGSPYYANPYYATDPFWPGYYPGMRYRPTWHDPNSKNESKIKTYESAVLAFDGQGKLLWDYSLKLNDIERKSLDQASDFYGDENNLVIISRHESELKAKFISIADGEATDLTEKIKLKNPADDLRHERENDNGIRYWTENTFYVWGYQTIRNVQEKGDKVRDVFYINKVVVE